jgi:hypothetical protein
MGNFRGDVGLSPTAAMSGFPVANLLVPRPIQPRKRQAGTRTRILIHTGAQYMTSRRNLLLWIWAGVTALSLPRLAQACGRRRRHTQARPGGLPQGYRLERWTVKVEDVGRCSYWFSRIGGERGTWWGNDAGGWHVSCSDIVNGTFTMDLQWDDSVTDYNFGALIGFQRAAGGNYMPLAFRFNPYNRTVDATYHQ